MENVFACDFQEWPKIPRYRRNVTVTEKIDGSNAQIAIFEFALCDAPLFAGAMMTLPSGKAGTRYAVFAGSRNRWLQPEGVGPKGCDNFGFARWVRDLSLETIRALGPGRHYGEWWGAGVGRRYGLTEKRFSLFNSARWGAHNPPPAPLSVVPVLYQGTPDGIEGAVSNLRLLGSRAAPGFMNPEGVIVYHADSRQYYKITLDNDEVPKSKVSPVKAPAKPDFAAVAVEGGGRLEYQAQFDAGLEAAVAHTLPAEFGSERKVGMMPELGAGHGSELPPVDHTPHLSNDPTEPSSGMDAGTSLAIATALIGPIF